MAKTASAAPEPTTVPTYIVYDKNTGRILQRHRASSAERDEYLACDEKALLKQVRDDDELVELVKSKGDIAVVRADMPEVGRFATGHIVDPRKKTLVARARIVLTADKREIEGDGSDATRISLHIEDAGGDKDTRFNGAVKIRTTRGKLSARKGIVEVEKGRAEFTLTSVAETADNVSVRAESPDGTLSPADITVAFV